MADHSKIQTGVRVKRILQALKSKTSCADCRVSYPYYVMHFDHRPGTGKRFNMAHAHRHSPAEALAELEKCDIVCANCHAERTHSRRKASD